MLRRTRLASVLLSFFAVACSSIPTAKFVEPRVGSPYLQLQNDQFHVYGATEALLGATGRRNPRFDGKNEFSRSTNAGTALRVKGTTVEVDRITLENVAAKAGVTVPNAELQVSGAADGQIVEKYVFSVLSLESPQALLDQIIRDSVSDQALLRLRDREFRFISSVVVASKFDVQNATNVAADVDGTYSTDGAVTLQASASGGSATVEHIVLPESAIVAYRWHAVCFRDGVPFTSTVHGRQIGDRPQNCRSYDKSRR